MVAGGEHTLVVCENPDVSGQKLLDGASGIKQDSPRVKVVDNNHGNGLRPMKMPFLLQLVQVNSFDLPLHSDSYEQLFMDLCHSATAFTEDLCSVNSASYHLGFYSRARYICTQQLGYSEACYGFYRTQGFKAS